MSAGRTLLAFSLMSSLSLCGALTGCSGTSEGTVAVVALAATVAATGLHRAATGDCWGRCSPGFACNSQSGFCEEADCSPVCVAGFSCMTSPTGVSCQPTKNTALAIDPSSTRLTVWGDSPDPTAFGTAANEGSPAASGLLPARAPTGQVQIPRGDPGAPNATGGTPAQKGVGQAPALPVTVSQTPRASALLGSRRALTDPHKGDPPQNGSAQE